MKKLLALLALAIALVVPDLAFGQGQALGPANYFICNRQAQITGTAALAQAVPLATAPLGPGGVQPSIYVCGFIFTNTAASGTVQIAYGTGANCGTGTTNLTPALSVGATAITSYTNNPSMVAAPGNALCVNATATVTGLLFFSQF